MKATGIIRRIDDLGRIVIPKEIRKKLKINDGENIEIYISDEKIILQKYSNIKNIKDIAQNLTDSIYSVLKDDVIITDTEMVISASGKYRKNLINKKISNELINMMNKKDNNIHNNINIVNDIEIAENFKINVITENGDIKGSIILISNNITKEKEQIININTTFLNKYLEE